MSAWTHTLRRALLWALSRSLALVAAPWRVAGELAFRLRFNRGYRGAPLMLDANSAPLSDRLALAILDGELPSSWIPLLEERASRASPGPAEEPQLSSRDLAWVAAVFAAYRRGHRDGLEETRPVKEER